MALANQIGLSTKVVSERHFIVSQTKLTAGEAAKTVSKQLKLMPRAILPPASNLFMKLQKLKRVKNIIAGLSL